MPTLIKALVFLIIVGGLAAGSIYSLATFVEPTPSETFIRVPSKVLNQRSE